MAETTGIQAAAHDESVAVTAFSAEYGRATTFVATAYTAGYESTGKHPGHPAYGITKSGRRVSEGRTIAVDPKVIPLGTWLYIEEIGLRRAEDTGGKIKGNRLDIYMESLQEALVFGVQDVDVYVLAAI